jgi:ribosomal protein S27E
MMNELDGNAAAGVLQEIFGREMTAVAATCATCGTVAPIGESGLYLGGPGTVIRCRSCDAVLVVVTQVRGMYCMDLMGIRSM